MKTTKTPYELLFRWNREGELAAHIKWRYVISENGQESETVSTATKVAIGETEGFPLSDCLPQVLIDALVEKDKAVQRYTDACALRDQLQEQVETLQSKLAQYEEGERVDTDV